MRTRLLAGETALADYEILEMLLFFGIERRDTKPLAKALINRFGSLAEVLSAGAGALARAGLTDRAAEALALVVEAADCLARPERQERAVLGTWDALVRHLDPPARGLLPAGLSGLLLNNRNQLLSEPSWAANADADTFGRELLRATLDRHASAVIIVRSNGSGPADIEARDRSLHAAVKRNAAALSVQVHDMVVLGGGKWASLRHSDGG